MVEVMELVDCRWHIPDDISWSTSHVKVELECCLRRSTDTSNWYTVQWSGTCPLL